MLKEIKSLKKCGGKFIAVKEKKFSSSKLINQNSLLNLSRKFCFPAIILRLYLVYGTHQDPNRVIPYTILNSIKDREFDCSHGKQFRDFLYIDDLINGIVKTLKKKNLSGEIINIGYGKPHEVRKVILKILKIIGYGKPKFGNIKLRKDEIFELYPKTSKAKKLINWTPQTGLITGLKKTINFYKKNKNFY